MLTLLIEFFSRDESDVSVRREGGRIVLAVDGRDVEMTRDEAAQLQEAVGDALTQRREFFRTAGVHREDGTYEVTRRGADSAGNSKVFEGFDALHRLYDRLPAEFSADDVGRTGITGSRRHMLVRHFAEHPAFDCSMARRNPLTVEKEVGESMADESLADETMSGEGGEAVGAD